MRTINMLMGILFILSGLLMIVNEGITFISVAFILGIILMVAGLAEVISFKSYRGDVENTTWILVDGTTTFILGFMIIMNKLASDATVPLVLGLWVMITGIRNLVRTLENREAKDMYYYGHAIIGDPLYSKIPAKRLMLHAHKLSFTHPFTLEKISVEAKSKTFEAGLH